MTIYSTQLTSITRKYQPCKVEHTRQHSYIRIEKDKQAQHTRKL